MKSRFVNSGVGFVVLFDVWCGVALIPKYSTTVPMPTHVLATLFSAQSLELALPTFITVKVVLLCLTLSLIAGYAMGCAIGLSGIGRAILYFPASAFKSVPV